MSAGGQDAAALTALLGAEVDVSAEDGKTRRGRLFSVDPVSRSLVLLQGRVAFIPPDAFSAETVQVVVGRAVTSVEVARPLSELAGSPEEVPAWSRRGVRLLGFAPDAPQAAPALSEAESARRRAALVAHLEKHFVPVEPSPDDPFALRVLGCLSVGPPFTPEACRSANVLVLDRVRRLVRDLADTGWGEGAAEGGDK